MECITDVRLAVRRCLLVNQFVEALQEIVRQRKDQKKLATVPEPQNDYIASRAKCDARSDHAWNELHKEVVIQCLLQRQSSRCYVKPRVVDAIEKDSKST